MIFTKTHTTKENKLLNKDEKYKTGKYRWKISEVMNEVSIVYGNVLSTVALAIMFLFFYKMFGDIYIYICITFLNCMHIST